MYHSDDKFGALILAEVKRKFSKEIKEYRDFRDIRERNTKVLQGIEPCRTFSAP